MNGIVQCNFRNWLNNNSLWNYNLIIKLTDYLQKHTDSTEQIKLFTHMRLTKHVYKIFYKFLNISDNTLIRIYWEEFKRIRSEYQELFQKSMAEFVTYKNNLEHYITKLFKKHKIPVDGDNILEVLSNYVEKCESSFDCKVCYAQKIGVAVVHEHHICAHLCQECSMKFKELSKCPFCTSVIINKKKLVY